MTVVYNPHEKVKEIDTELTDQSSGDLKNQDPNNMIERTVELFKLALSKCKGYEKSPEMNNAAPPDQKNVILVIDSFALYELDSDAPAPMEICAEPVRAMDHDGISVVPPGSRKKAQWKNERKYYYQKRR